MNNLRRNLALMLLPGLFLAGCNTVEVKSSEPITLLVEDTEQINEEHLLDVGIGIFEPGPEQLPEEEEEEDAVFTEVRKAETQYMPVVLATTLQNTGGWGAVRVIPEQRSEMDVWVEGEILESDGEVLKLRIRVKDSVHREWFQKTYQAKVGKNSYNPQRSRAEEPFQGLYNQIANDMLAYRRALTPAELGKIRTITELNFARRFSPEAFSEYLEVDKRGRYQILRLPAENDPFLTRVRQIRARDDLFVDTLQDHYGFFAQQMETPYQHWRHENYKENMKIRHVKASARRRMFLGALGVIGGIAAIATIGSSPNPFLGTVGGIGGTVGVGAGVVGFKRGWDERKEVKLHQEALREIAASLDAEIKPHTLTLEDRTVTLTGTVEQQYQQWQEILRQIYLQETGAVTIDAAEASP